MLSRFPIDDSAVVSLPAAAADGERIAQVVRIRIGVEYVVVANLHLTHLGGAVSGEMRRRELETLLLHPWFLDDVAVTLIGGDFNTVESALPLLIEAHEGYAIHDTWKSGNGIGPRSTIPVHLPPEDDRSRCVDYLLSLTRAGTSGPPFIASQVVLGDPSADGHFPSDHRGIATTLILDHSDE